MGKKLKNTSLTHTHLNEITSSSDSSKNVKEDSVEERLMESAPEPLNAVQFCMKNSVKLQLVQPPKKKMKKLKRQQPFLKSVLSKRRKIRDKKRKD